METSAVVPSRTRSALIGCYVGVIWMLWSNAFIGVSVVLWGSATTLLACAVIVWSISKVRFIRRCTTPYSDSQPSGLFNRVYWVIVVLEVLLAIFAVAFLAVTHRQQLIPVVIAFIVGLHFFPLARLLKLPTLYATATTMVVIAAISMVISDADIRNVVVCAGIGISMWAKATWTLHQIVSSLKATPVA